MTVIGEPVPDVVWPPLDGFVESAAMTVYSSIVDPPVSLGGVKFTTALSTPAVAVPIVGAPGTVLGPTKFQLDEVVPMV